ncbi:hypothetical protein VTO42DRAFT_5772 [Malbranchea cinnamomea]
MARPRSQPGDVGVWEPLGQRKASQARPVKPPDAKMGTGTPPPRRRDAIDLSAKQRSFDGHYVFYPRWILQSPYTYSDGDTVCTSSSPWAAVVSALRGLHNTKSPSWVSHNLIVGSMPYPGILNIIVIDSTADKRRDQH